MIPGEKDPGGPLWRRRVWRSYGAGRVLSSGEGGVYSAPELLSFEADIIPDQANTSVISCSK